MKKRQRMSQKIRKVTMKDSIHKQHSSRMLVLSRAHTVWETETDARGSLTVATSRGIHELT